MVKQYPAPFHTYKKLYAQEDVLCLFGTAGPPAPHFIPTLSPPDHS